MIVQCIDGLHMDPEWFGSYWHMYCSEDEGLLFCFMKHIKMQQIKAEVLSKLGVRLTMPMFCPEHWFPATVELGSGKLYNVEADSALPEPNISRGKVDWLCVGSHKYIFIRRYATTEIVEAIKAVWIHRGLRDFLGENYLLRIKRAFKGIGKMSLVEAIERFGEELEIKK